MPAVAGLMFGHLLATVIVVAGVGVLIAGYPLALSAITLLGALYLLWLGIGILRNRPALTAGEMAPSNRQRLVIKGLCISGLNPKVFLLFLALLPQFTDPRGNWPVAMQMSMLGAMHLFTCTIIYLLVGYSSRVVLSTRPQAARMVNRVSGVMMILIAGMLLHGQISDL